MNKDPDSPDYNDTNQGEGSYRETQEEKEIRGLQARLDAMSAPICKAALKVASEIQEIMQTYREQAAHGNIDTPGGLEHMGDVWRLFAKWDGELTGASDGPSAEQCNDILGKTGHYR